LLVIRGLRKDSGVTGSIMRPLMLYFFEFVPYFSSDSPNILSIPVPFPWSVHLSSPEPIPDATAPRSQSECTEQPALKSLQVFTRCLKVSATPSALDDSSPIASSPP